MATAMEAAVAGIDPQRDIYRLAGRRTGRSAGLLVFKWALLWILVLAPAVSAASQAAKQRDVCLESSGQAVIDACTAILNEHPEDTTARLALGQAFIASRQYGKAADLFRDGLKLDPGNQDLATQLSLAEQLIDEQRWIEKKQQQRDPASGGSKKGKDRIAARRLEIRCTKLQGAAALEACIEGLREFPGNAVFYRGKGNALMQVKRYGEALDAFQDALVLDPADTLSKSGIVKARSQRKISFNKCMQLDGQVALNACQAALIKGGSDEFAIEQRRGDLLQAAGNTEQAISAYQAALAIDSRNPAVLNKLERLGAPSEKDKEPPVKPMAAAKPEPKPALTEAEPPKRPRPKPAPQDPAKPPKPAASPPPAAETPRAALSVPAVKSPPAKHRAARPVEEETGKYSNAPLASGFTH